MVYHGAKRRLLIVLCAVIALLSTCAAGQRGSGAEVYAPAGEYLSAVKTLSVSGVSDVSGGETDSGFYDLVFDTAQDAGKLTARYLYLRETVGEGKDMITTGDSAVYTSPDGHVMLVDCGNSAGGQEVTRQLQAMGVSELDIVVLSHPHADHVGGFVTVAENFPIGQVYMNGHEYDSKTYDSVAEKIKELGIPCQILKEGDSFSLGEEVHVQVFGPPEGDTDSVAGGYQDANDGSIAMRITYGESSFWTSGDLYVPGEQRLAKTYGEQMRSDVLKMDHHGKDSSNGKDFVQAVSPKIAVGMFDSIGSRMVCMRYSAAGVQVFYTAADGAVRVSTTGDGTYDVQTQLLRGDVPVLSAPSEDGHYVIQ